MTTLSARNVPTRAWQARNGPFNYVTVDGKGDHTGEQSPWGKVLPREEMNMFAPFRLGFAMRNLKAKIGLVATNHVPNWANTEQLQCINNLQPANKPSCS